MKMYVVEPREVHTLGWNLHFWLWIYECCTWL